MENDMISYYNDRVAEYERIYQKPERQEELLHLTKLLQRKFANKIVFEIACGTGYWTERIAATARAVLATDVSELSLKVAESKTYKKANVTFDLADIFELRESSVKSDYLFGGFIWSHIKLQELELFIDNINSCVEAGGTVVLMDNNYVEGSSLPIHHQDEAGNTYQKRLLSDGTEHMVVKNFPSEDFVRQALHGRVKDIEFVNMNYYWLLSYKVAA